MRIRPARSPRTFRYSRRPSPNLPATGGDAVQASTATTARGSQASRSAERRGLTHRQRNTLTAYLYISPAIIGLFVFMLYPLVSSVYHAFTKWDGLSAAKWTGLDNFRYMFAHDPTFWPS